MARRMTKFNQRKITETPPYQRITLVSTDRKLFEIDVNTVLRSQFLRYILNADYINGVIQIKNVNGRTLEKVIEYCNIHAIVSDYNAGIGFWDAEFVKKMDIFSLFNVMKAASFLEIENLLDLTCWNVAERIKYKTLEEIRCFLIMHQHLNK